MAKTRSVLSTPTSGPVADHAIDWIYFVLGGLAAVWLAWVLVRQSFTFGWWQIAFVVVFWGALAYLVLPRLHRILTAIYVPDYFIGRARTSDGLLGDPVNLALHGSEAEIHEAMEAAGWTRADDLSFRTGMKIVQSTITRKSYLRAPVSPLLLFGRKQDFAYQQEVDGSPGKRHHVRFWKTPDGWKLPGGHPADWLAAGTYDKSVGFSLYTLQVTHKIADDTDEERDHIVKTVLGANAKARVTVIEDFSTGYHSRNGGGDTIVTDGNLPVLDLRPMHSVDAKTVAIPTDSRDQRPSATVLGAILVAIGGIIGLVTGIAQILQAPTESATVVGTGDLDTRTLINIALVVVGAIIIAVALVQVLLAVAVFRGGNRARVLVMFLSALLVVSLIVGGEFGDTEAITSNLPGVALNVLVLLTLSSERAMEYARRLHPGKNERADARKGDRGGLTPGVGGRGDHRDLRVRPVPAVVVVPGRPRRRPDRSLDLGGRRSGPEQRDEGRVPADRVEGLRGVLGGVVEARVAARAATAARSPAVVERVVAVPPRVDVVLLAHPAHHHRDVVGRHRHAGVEQHELRPVVVGRARHEGVDARGRGVPVAHGTVHGGRRRHREVLRVRHDVVVADLRCGGRQRRGEGGDRDESDDHGGSDGDESREVSTRMPGRLVRQGEVEAR